MQCNRIVTLSLVFLSILQAPIARADENADLKALLFSCDRAVNSCKATSDAKDAVIQSQQTALELANTRVTNLEHGESSIMKSPIFYYTLGLLTTALAAHLVNKP